MAQDFDTRRHFLVFPRLKTQFPTWYHRLRQDRLLKWYFTLIILPFHDTCCTWLTWGYRHNLPSKIRDNQLNRRSQWPRVLKRRSTAARPLRLWLRIPLGAWKLVVSVVCCQVVLCDGLITRPGESYRLWRVVVCDQETSRMRRLNPATGLWKIQPNGL
jgi:hypothetical protein